MPPSESVPAGTLIPIPDTPGFPSKTSAMKFIKNNYKRFEGSQIMVIRGLEIVAPRISTSIELDIKPKTLVKGAE